MLHAYVIKKLPINKRVHTHMRANYTNAVHLPSSAYLLHLRLLFE